jgi:hypothetical protein
VGAALEDVEQELRARVALMRELGVLRWDGIVLGPAPTPREDAASRLARARTDDERVEAQEALTKETAAEALARDRENMRMALASSMPDATDAHIDALLGVRQP